MTVRDTDGGKQVGSARLSFGRFVLDSERGCLLVDGSELPLRPKTFTVLDYLVRNAGRLISKDELIAAVWRNAAVTDDALVQSVGELRRALGDEGAQLIKTVPRRGYRFDAEIAAVVDASPTSPTPALASAAPLASMSSVPTAAPINASPMRAGRWRSRPTVFLYSALAAVALVSAWAVWATLNAHRAPNLDAR